MNELPFVTPVLPEQPNSSSQGSVRATGSVLPIGPQAKARIRIVVVDDEAALRDTCASVLQLDGYDVTVCERGQEALDLLRRRAFDIVLIDLHMSSVDGLALLRAALATSHDSVVIVMTDNPSLDSCMEALRQGAWDYLPKPFSAAHLQILVGRAAHALLVSRETREVRSSASGRAIRGEPITLLGTAPGFRTAVELARKVAPTDASVFLTGESGSGKELIAQFIHSQSRRSTRPFVAINCAALPESLLESEMFGHRKGAFTGAVRDKPGLLEAANGGTLFLDELVEMSKAIQAKLLRVLQDGVVRRVGSETTDAVVNVRFVAATNGDPEAAIASGALREDLYYRLCVVPIRMPPLRERPEDIPMLAEHFFATYWTRHRGKHAAFPKLTDAAIRALTTHHWRGNVRELQNVIEHVAVIVEPGSAIRPEQLRLAADPAAVAVGSPDATVPAGDAAGAAVPVPPARSMTDPNPASLIATLLEESYHAPGRREPHHAVSDDGAERAATGPERRLAHGARSERVAGQRGAGWSV